MTALPSQGLLTISPAAVVDNWRLFSGLGTAEAAAVVKADAYGLGADPIATALVQAGCRTFFVATLTEGLALRRLLPQPEIFVLNGPMAGEESCYADHRLIPVLNSPQQVILWQAMAGLPAALHLDTGMTRLGLDEADCSLVYGLNLRLVMSHLACADDPDHPANRRQLERFRTLTTAFPGVPRSLSASGGSLLGAEYHFDLLRPGIGLYGGNPIPSRPNPSRAVVRLTVPILQVRTVGSGVAIGYGEAGRTTTPTRILTLAAGYADGLLRRLGNRGAVVYEGVVLPIIGRISMDLITVDAQALGKRPVNVGDRVELLGDQLEIDAMADAAETISYELLTRLGTRYQRVYA